MSRPRLIIQPAGASSPKPPDDSDRQWTILGIYIFLAAIVWIVFGQTLRHEFINYDDGYYVYEDATIAQGLTFKGVAAAFSCSHSDNWVPLTTVSHMLDCQFYGLNAGGHHLTNVLLHTASVLLLFLVLRQMTGAVWRSAFVAALFAIHPLHVESVAWVSERKDMLSGMFFMLTLWAYVRYVRNPGSLVRYLAVAFLFALGLMSKPMLVTLPFVLMLLDYWPLNRFSQASAANEKVGVAHRLKNLSIAQRLIMEKIPLLMLSFASCIPTVLAERVGMQSMESYPLPLRIGNALVSYIVQMGRMFYPAKLAVFYPFPADGLPFLEIISAALLLAGISLGVFLWRRKHPYLLVGWLWYLGMLVPVIGLVQVGSQAQADRHTYLPQIGLYVLLTWMIADLSARLRHCFLALAGASAIILVTLIFCARAQAAYWKNSETLFSHALAVTKNNDIAHSNLGAAFEQQQKWQEALVEYHEAAKLVPDRYQTHNNIGNILGDLGEQAAAAAEYRIAIGLNPSVPFLHNSLGGALAELGRFNEAMAEFTNAIRLDPSYATPHVRLGDVLLKQGRDAGAIAQFKEAMRLAPFDYQTLAQTARVLATIENPDVRDGKTALILAVKANVLAGGTQPLPFDILGMAFAENGDFSNAQNCAQNALDLATASKMKNLEPIQQRLQFYKNHRPWRESFLATNAPPEILPALPH